MSTGTEYTRRMPGLPAKINGQHIPFWDKKQALVAARIMRLPKTAIQRVITSFDEGYALWTGVRFIHRTEWMGCAKTFGVDLYSNNWHESPAAMLVAKPKLSK